MPDRRALGLVVLGCLAATLGWWVFWFQCDDAYIAFRYVSNRQAGWGYVWNPPPFLPVEGYTSFAWVVLLDAVWTLTGLDPERSATWLDLLATWATVGLVVGWTRRLHDDAPDATGLAWAAVAVFGCVTNTTFLAWSSSGLETPLFQLLLLGWMAWGLARDRGDRWAAVGMAWAAGLALTRPDGLLFLAATPVVILADRTRGLRRADLLALAPLLLPIAHTLWRRATYGFWLPNTYAAKHVAPWPVAGMNWFWAFTLEYTAWIWWAVVLAALWQHRRTAVASTTLRAWAPGAVALAALVAHGAYYVFRVGGDHFEYRAIAHWVPLAWIAWGWLVRRSGAGRRSAWALTVLALVGTWWIAWPDWVQMRTVTTKEVLPKLRLPLADLYPAPLRPYVARHDDLERWLTRHTVRISHQTHRLFRVVHQENFPERTASLEEAGPERWTDAVPPEARYPVVALGSVGVASWRMPYVAILDRMGLNDLVVARTPVREGAYRYMAHDRRPPDGYLECFRPNLRWGPGRFTVKDRKRNPLTADAIRACEQTWLQRALDGALTPPDADEDDAD